MKNKISVILFSTLIMTAIFHKQALGLNLFFYEILLFAYLFFTKQFRLTNTNEILISAGMLSSSLFTVLTHSIFSYIMNFVAVFIITGVLIYPHAKSVLTSFWLSANHLIKSQIQFLSEISEARIGRSKFGKSIRKVNIFLIPLVIIVVFVWIYRLSNPVFDGFMNDTFLFLEKPFKYLFEDFDFLVLLTFFICLMISNFLLFKTIDAPTIERDMQSDEQLQRKRKKALWGVKSNSLLNEYKAGIFLLMILNIILLILNIIDINWVWFNFKWEGQYLKQFVHEGTYLLILSILISIVMVLYFFRSNLNFYSKNRSLKYLSYVWLAQNGILSISVAIRNFYYIEHFNLAYKRIGVLIFLLLTLYGLFTVFIKVKERKSAFYLFKTNALSLYIVLMISSFINWDSLIARYNFNHADKAFVHLDFLSTLSDKALPYLDKTIPELNKINQIQESDFSFREKFMSPETYHDTINNRKKDFLLSWRSKSILSWNLPEYLAYEKLKNIEPKE
jgi:hypothetical protein